MKPFVKYSTIVILACCVARYSGLFSRSNSDSSPSNQEAPSEKPALPLTSTAKPMRSKNEPRKNSATSRDNDMANKPPAKSDAALKTPHDDHIETNSQPPQDEGDEELSDTNAVAAEMERMQELYEVWKEERTNFYREELELNESEIDWLNRLEERAGAEIHSIVQMIENGGEALKLDDESSQKSIQKILDSYERDVSRLMGEDKIEKLKKFRETYNAQIDARFESKGRVVGF